MFSSGKEIGDPDKQFRWRDWTGFRRELGWGTGGNELREFVRGLGPSGEPGNEAAVVGWGFSVWGPGAIEFRVAVCQLN